MNKKNRSGSGPFLMEMLIVAGFFAVCASIFVLAFAKADALSRQARNLNQAVLQAQSITEEVKAGTLSMSPGEEKILAVWDSKWNRYPDETVLKQAGETLKYAASANLQMEGKMAALQVSILEYSDKNPAETKELYCLESGKYIKP